MFAVCALSIDIVSSASISVTADGYNVFPIYGFASALGVLTDSSPNVDVEAIVTDGPCEGLTRTLWFH